MSETSTPYITNGDPLPEAQSGTLFMALPLVQQREEALKQRIAELEAQLAERDGRRCDNCGHSRMELWQDIDWLMCKWRGCSTEPDDVCRAWRAREVQP